MHDMLSPVRRSLVFRGGDGGSGGGSGGGIGGVVEKIGSSIRKSRMGIFTKTATPSQASPVVQRDEDRSIRWWKGEMIGGGAFGCVYMGMNIDSGELLAIKQVSIAGGSASKDKTQAHIRELEEEVRLLKNLSHPNIVRYLGTAREDESFNILLEFVPGGSISSLLGKFGSFPEAVVRRYTKQILLGLEYLHRNGIIHRDIKGANILVDNMGHIKLADFGASKKVVELATMNAAKSMKGTPYWMAPEVILQTGHSFSADIWSVGCTIIEMATGKPPWSQQYQEVAAIFYIGTTKSHPPIPDHLSPDAKDFLLKCLQKEPNLRPTALDLLQHPYVRMKNQDALSPSSTPFTEHPANTTNIPRSPGTGESRSSVLCSAAAYPGARAQQGRHWVAESCDDMCRIDDKDDLLLRTAEKFHPTSAAGDIESFNPISEPADDWPCRFENNSSPSGHGVDGVGIETDFTFPCGGLSAGEEDEEVTESRIRLFLDDKAMELKRLQSPLYEEFCNSLNVGLSPTSGGGEGSTATSNPSFDHPTLPPKTKSPTPVLLPSRTFSTTVDTTPLQRTNSSSSSTLITSSKSPRLSQWKTTLSPSFSERQRKWKEELDEELARKREMMRQTCGVSRQRERLWSPGR